MPTKPEREPKYSHVREATEMVTGTKNPPAMNLYCECDPELTEKLKEAGRQSREITGLAEELRKNPSGFGRLLVKSKYRLRTAIKMR